MGTVDQYRARADFCQRMAEKAIGEKARATWLNLAANALASAESRTDPFQIAPSKEAAALGGDKTGHFSGQ
jgi:hypothetical protein